MAINKKLLHFVSKSNFSTQLANSNIDSKSIIFIKDTGELWTHDKFYSCATWGTTQTNYTPLTVAGVTYNLSKDGHNHDTSYVTSLGISGNYLTWLKNGVTNNITIPFATNAGTLSANGVMTYGWNGMNYFNISGTAGNEANVNDTPTTTWWHITRFNHANASGYYTDLAIPFQHDSLYWKAIRGGTVANGGWIKVLDLLNYTTYLVPKTGGAFSGNISTTGTFVSTGTSTSFGFIKTGSSSAYVLLGDGGHKLITDFSNADTVDNFHTDGILFYNSASNLVIANDVAKIVWVRVAQNLRVFNVNYIVNGVWSNNNSKFYIEINNACYNTASNIKIQAIRQNGFWLDEVRLTAGSNAYNRDVWFRLVIPIGNETNGYTGTLSVKSNQTLSTLVETTDAPTSTIIDSITSIVGQNTTTFYSGVHNFQDGLVGNITSATQLLNTRTLWGQNFNGTANVSGDMTGVGNITMSGANILKAVGASLSLMANNGSSGGNLSFTAGVFRPYAADHNLISLGQSNIRWSNVYSSLLDISGIATCGSIRTLDNSDWSLILRNNGLTALYVQNSTASGGIASFRYGSASASGGTSVLDINSGSVISSVGYSKSGSSDYYVLLGGGGSKAISDFSVSSHTHIWNNITTSSITDFDTFRNVDFQFSYAVGSNTVDNKPSGTDAFGAISFRTAGGWFSQLVRSSNTDNSWKFRDWTGSVWSSWGYLLDSNNYTNYTVSKTGTGASGTWGINISGNATQLNWKAYGGAHVIFDASAGLTPTGSVCDKDNSEIVWSSTYPTLMGWNGTNTCGVRVDAARQSNILSTARTIWGQSFNGSTNISGDLTGVGNITASGNISTTSLISARAIELSSTTPFIDFHFGSSTADYTSRIIEDSAGQLTFSGNIVAGIITARDYLHVNNTISTYKNTPIGTNYANLGIVINSTDGSPVGIGFYRQGYTECILEHTSTGLAVTHGTIGEGNYAALTASDIYSMSWFRSVGNTGWINDTYGGGIYMTDSSWIRTYGSKSFYVDGNIEAIGDITSTTASFGDWEFLANTILKTNNTACKLLMTTPNGYLDINDGTTTLLSIRNDGESNVCLNISAYANSTALRISSNGDTGVGNAIESYGDCKFTARTGEYINFFGNTRFQGFWLQSSSLGSNTTATIDDSVIYLGGTTQYTVTLPLLPTSTSAGYSKVLFIKNVANSRKYIRPASGNYIFYDADSVATYADPMSIESVGDAFILVSSGTYWYQWKCPRTW